ncbi:cystine/glutamate transporter-like [Lytechinus variegatus]|uniref:cystine/glutamate transporter-like n=1 Tax=Lytechinus variegatus TaxID=7654 RepID=UPI001BB191F8|nr:cystine/glutamate transporter-like [Lytechinus variegatus]
MSRNPASSQSTSSSIVSQGGDKNDVKLIRQMTLIDCISIVIGIIIGGGIFISPKGVLVNTGSTGWALVVWVLCGVFSMFGGLCYAELGTTFKVSGGDFSFILDAFGPVPAFVRIWTRIVAVRTGSRAINSVSFAYYVLLPFYMGCEVPFAVTRLIGAALLLLIVIINSLSVPLTRKIQVATSACKVLGLIVIIVAGFYQLVKGNTSNIDTAFVEGSIKWKTIPLAFYSGLYAYSGWEFLPSISEEIINPGRTIPLAIIISVIFVTIIYVLANIAYFTVLNSAELLASSAVALDFGQRVFGSWSWILSAVVAISIAGNLNGGSITFARVLLVASREGHIPKVLSMVHINQKTPLPAAAGLLPISIIMLISGDVSSLINYTGFAGWFFTALACAVIPYYRWKYPNLKRPFKVPLVIPIIFVCCALFLVGMSIYSSPVDCGIGLAITLLGIPVYYVGVAWKNKPKWFKNGMDNLTVFLQQVVMVVPQDGDDEMKEKLQFKAE